MQLLGSPHPPARGRAVGVAGGDHSHEDCVNDAVGLALKHFVALTRRGRNPAAFITTLALSCAQAVKAGRRLAGCDPAADALSAVARARHGFRVERLPLRFRADGPLAEALADNTLTPVPEQVCFRHDFPAWLATRTGRDRELIAVLLAGERTTDAARAFGVSPGRVSQLRTEYLADWAAFGG